VGKSALHFFHLQLHEVRLHNMLEFGDAFVVQTITFDISTL